MSHSVRTRHARVMPLIASGTLLLTVALGGCSGDNGNFFTTGALGDSKPATPVVAPVSPACQSLAAQIDKLHQDGAVDRLDKVASEGTAGDVKIKRSTLQTQAQLNKANAEFIAKCGPALPKSTTAAAAPATPAVPTPTTKVAQAAAAKAAANTSASGVTIAPPAAGAAAEQPKQ